MGNRLTAACLLKGFRRVFQLISGNDYSLNNKHAPPSYSADKRVRARLKTGAGRHR